MDQVGFGVRLIPNLWVHEYVGFELCFWLYACAHIMQTLFSLFVFYVCWSPI